MASASTRGRDGGASSWTAAPCDASPEDDTAQLVADLSEQRDDYIGPLLRLPAPHNVQFWKDPATQRRLLHLDVWGVATGLAINTLITAAIVAAPSRRDGPGLLPPLSVLLCQLLQLLYLRLRTAGYLRHRNAITMLQRSLRICQVLYSFSLVTAAHTSRWIGREAAEVQSWRPMCILLLIAPGGWALHTLHAVWPMRGCCQVHPMALQQCRADAAGDVRQ